MSNTVIIINEGDGVTDLSITTNFNLVPPKQKRKWTSSKEKNLQTIKLKVDAAGEKKLIYGALVAAIELINYTDTINRKVQRNKKYI